MNIVVLQIRKISLKENQLVVVSINIKLNKFKNASYVIIR